MRHLFLFIITLSLSGMAKAQHFTDAGNSWIITKLNWETETVYNLHIKIDGDTLIQNQVYKTLLQADDVYNPVWYRVHYVLREDDQKIVYIRDATGQEGILYHFGIQAGQQVELWNGFTVTLNSIDSVPVANHQTQKRLRLRATSGPQGWECTSFAAWIDEIGDDTGPMPFDFCFEPDISYGLGCFLQNEEVYFAKSASWCEGFTTATIPVTETGFDVFPNPVIDWLTIQLRDAQYPALTIQLYNAQGQLVYHHRTSERLQQIDMSAMAGGMYYLKVASGNQNLSCVKIVKL